MKSCINAKRLVIALIIAGLCGLACANGMANLEIPGLVVSTELLLTTFYSRLLIGFIIGLTGCIQLIKGEFKNAALRGAIMGAIVSVGISFYGGAAVMIAFGTVYGIITDLVATKLG